MTGWNLPPGCTEADIDATCVDEESECCIVCGAWWTAEQWEADEVPADMTCDACRATSESTMPAFAFDDMEI